MYVGVDCGTQSTKVVVVDVDNARILGEASRSHQLLEGENGRREQDPEEWMTAFSAAFAEALGQAGIDGQTIRAIGISGQQHGLVALDADGQPVHPAKLWCDTETARHNALLVDRLGGEAGCLEKLGLVLQTGYTASKLAWLREQHPDAYARIDSILLPHDYLNFRLTGQRVAEAGDASGTGYFDTRTCQWREDVFAVIAPELDPDQVLPRLIRSHEPAGIVRPELAKRFGLGNNVMVSSGGGDNMMGAIGTGNIRPGLVTISLGTSGTVYAFSKTPVLTDNAMIANFCASSDGWLPLACTMNVTSATTLVRQLFNLNLADFGDRVAQAPVGAEGVTVLPFFNGERVPMLPHATASFIGLDNLNMSQANLCRAVVEGATFGLRYGLEHLGDLAQETRQIRLIGGGARSPIWRQIVADVLSADVICPRINEAAALGAAIQAAWCHGKTIGTGPSLEQLCGQLVRLDESTLAQPRAPNRTGYETAYQRYRSALEKRYGVTA